MKKKRSPAKRPTRTTKDPLEGNPVQRQDAYVPAGSLLNKYNQKKPSGMRKLSPAADEEME